MTQTAGGKLLHWLREEFKPELLLPSLIAGILIGFSEIIDDISFGSLIFTGELTRYLAFGFGLALTTSTVFMIVTSLLSSVPGMIGGTQDSPTVILAIIASALVAASVVKVEDKLATILIAIAFSAVLTGVFLLAVGYFKLGGLVRFIPYPVIGGFLAGTGWLLWRGSFGVMTGLPLAISNISALLQSERLVLWIPGVTFALLLFVALQRFRHPLVMPGILVGTIALFYVILWAAGISVQEATKQGLVLGAASGKITWQPLAMKNLLSANWIAILGQASNIATILILAVISLLMNASGLELALGKDINLNRELQVAGVANILSGASGGMIGYHVLYQTTLSHRMGARTRLTGLVAGVFCAVMLFAGSALLAYFPRPILGGLLFLLGTDFLYEWVIAGLVKLSRTDYVVVLLILVVIATTNFLFGVAVGLVAAIILFVLNYSRINVIHHALSGAEVRSNLERCAYHQRVLTEKLGGQIHILELQGFIFFGTANALLEKVRARITDSKQPRLRYVILDFSRVTGLDSSAVLSFVKGKKLADTQNITLVLTHLSANAKRQFEKGDLFTKENEVRIFPDLDHGLEWCEEQLLDIEQVTTLHTPITLTAQLADSGFERSDTKRLLKYLERVEFKEGEILIHQGDEADRMYFVEMGSITVYLELGNEQVRLQTLGLGTAVGEAGLYQGTKSTASAIADTPVTAYRLTRATLAEMKKKEPELAATFHEFAARMLSERLTATTRTLEAVLR